MRLAWRARGRPRGGCSGPGERGRSAREGGVVLFFCLFEVEEGRKKRLRGERKKKRATRSRFLRRSDSALFRVSFRLNSHTI